jgi:hypothetical protein
VLNNQLKIGLKMETNRTNDGELREQGTIRYHSCNSFLAIISIIRACTPKCGRFGTHAWVPLWTRRITLKSATSMIKLDGVENVAITKSPEHIGGNGSFEAGLPTPAGSQGQGEKWDETHISLGIE